MSPNGFPALVLNADFRPLSYYPLSLWSWQDAIKAVFLERVNIVALYEKVVHSPSFEMKLPSVVSLKTFVKPSTHPAFTRFNVFLRDKFVCQYCGADDDLIPVQALFHATQALTALEIPVEWHISAGIGHGIDQEGLRQGGEFLARRRF